MAGLDDPGQHGWLALAFGMVMTAAAWLWRGIFWGRAVKRDDRAADEQVGGYSKLVQDLETRIQRLSDRLDEEVTQRRQVEQENMDLRLRVSHLESCVRKLGGTV